MPFKNGNLQKHEIVWTSEMLDFLHANFHTMTNPELAKHLGLGVTSVKTKCYSLGLKRMELERWTVEQIELLKQHFRRCGFLWPKLRILTTFSSVER